MTEAAAWMVGLVEVLPHMGLTQVWVSTANFTICTKQGGNVTEVEEVTRASSNVRLKSGPVCRPSCRHEAPAPWPSLKNRTND